MATNVNASLLLAMLALCVGLDAVQAINTFAANLNGERLSMLSIQTLQSSYKVPAKLLLLAKWARSLPDWSYQMGYAG